MKSAVVMLQVVEEEDKMVAYFVIVVHLHSAATCHTIMHQDDTYGWVVSRTLAQFHELHRKLIPVSCKDSELDKYMLGF